MRFNLNAVTYNTVFHHHTRADGYPLTQDDITNENGVYVDKTVDTTVQRAANVHACRVGKRNTLSHKGSGLLCLDEALGFR